MCGNLEIAEPGRRPSIAQFGLDQLKRRGGKINGATLGENIAFIKQSTESLERLKERMASNASLSMEFNLPEHLCPHSQVLFTVEFLDYTRRINAQPFVHQHIFRAHKIKIGALRVRGAQAKSVVTTDALRSVLPRCVGLRHRQRSRTADAIGYDRSLSWMRRFQDCGSVIGAWTDKSSDKGPCVAMRRLSPIRPDEYCGRRTHRDAQIDDNSDYARQLDIDFDRRRL
jgi:hypothetical protein